MRNIFIYIALLWGITSAQAQTTKEELAEFPETMQSDMDSLYWDWQSKNFITIDENCRMLPEGPKVSDSVYIDRLSRIPSIIEMPFNDIVKKHIEAYTGRLRNKVSFMLAAANFYMPMFEEALDILMVGHIIEGRHIGSTDGASRLMQKGLTGIGSLLLHIDHQAGKFHQHILTLTDGEDVEEFGDRLGIV